MKFNKRVLARAEHGYSVSTQRLLGERRVVVASEGTEPALTFVGQELEPVVLVNEPGGCMGFAPVHGRDDALFMVGEFFPIFRAETSGIYFTEATDGVRAPWSVRRIVELPFVHRIAAITIAGWPYLIASTVCEAKKYQEDWSKPGTVYAYPVADDGTLSKPVVLLENIHRNHGLTAGSYRGVDVLLIAGDEGVLALEPPAEVATREAATERGNWKQSKVLDFPVSELVLADLDGDGTDELVIVTPFHGDELAVYKDSGTSWSKVYSAELAFGHGLSAGVLAGEAVVTVGNRSGSNDLLCFRTSSVDPFDMQRIVVDCGTGTAGTAFVETGDTGSIVTSNAEQGEYALYTPVHGKS